MKKAWAHKGPMLPWVLMLYSDMLLIGLQVDLLRGLVPACLARHVPCQLLTGHEKAECEQHTLKATKLVWQISALDEEAVHTL